MKKLVLLFLFILTGAIFPAADTVIITRDYIPYADTTLVFHPQTSAAERNYPVLFLLHGWSGNHKYWNSIADIQKYSDEYGFIIVCPEGFYNSWYLNSLTDNKSQYEKFFFNDLLPEIFSKYNADTSNVFISGLSMGGHGAMKLFLARPELFKGAGSMSGVLDLTFYPNNPHIMDQLGPYASAKEKWEANSAIYNLYKVTGMGKAVFLDCGTDDFTYEPTKAYYEKCVKLGINAMFISRPGKHNKEFWMKSIKYNLDFFKDIAEKR
jgi:S-formylglutathione hydrolase FrmB